MQYVEACMQHVEVCMQYMEVCMQYVEVCMQYMEACMQYMVYAGMYMVCAGMVYVFFSSSHPAYDTHCVCSGHRNKTFPLICALCGDLPKDEELFLSPELQAEFDNVSPICKTCHDKGDICLTCIASHQPSHVHA